MFPGLRNPGVMLIVKTEPAGAAIRVNDVYFGLAGSRIFVPKGTHTITAAMPGFESTSAVHHIPGRIFGSLFFPLVYRTELTLTTADPAITFALYAADFATWTFAGEPSASWQIPLSLSEGAYRVGPYGGTETIKDKFQDKLRAASRFAVTRAALRDLVRAKILLDNYGNAPAPPALIDSIYDVLAFLSENPGSAQWLSDFLPREAAVIIEASNWYTHFILFQDNVLPSAAGTAERQLTFAGLNFISIPAANTFLISESPVSRSLFETFLNENPQWRDHQTDYFPQEITFNRMYTYRSDIITGMTWYAALAFCKWLTEQLPPFMANMEIRLPTEDEWLAASQSISNMRVPGWEWCADYYAPLTFIAASPEVINSVGSPERSLRGRPSIASSETRASLPPDLSSPFVTFRIVLDERK
jgi:hypothetical protein